MKATLYAAPMVFLVVAVSCGQHDPHAPHPVRGKVFFRGRPAEGAQVVFYPHGSPDAPSPRPAAVVGKDGTFRLTTRLAFDGAPAGHYAVTVIYRALTYQADDEDTAGPDLLQGRYSDPQTSPLQASVVAGPNDLAPFFLE